MQRKATLTCQSVSAQGKADAVIANSMFLSADLDMDAFAKRVQGSLSAEVKKCRFEVC